MVSVLIATHGKLSVELLRSCEMIVGKSEKVITMSLNLGDSVDNFNEQFCKNIRSLDDGDGVLVLVDIYAGSPSNVAMKNIRKLNYECVCGVNLAMTIEILTARKDKTLQEVKEIAINTGIQSIIDQKEILNLRSV